jgi:hypothetical protein
VTDEAKASSPPATETGGDDAATRTYCTILHQGYAGGHCQSRCTLHISHDGPHYCGNGHDF